MKSGTLAAIHRWRPWRGDPPKGIPFVIDWRSYDIPNTVYHAIRNAPVGCVAITLSPRGGLHMIKAAENAARQRGIRVLWWTY